VCQPKYNQEWLGPDQTTGGTVLYRPSWDGKEYTKCVNLRQGDTTNGNAIEIWDCNGVDAQQWVGDPKGGPIRYAKDNKKCIDAGNMTQGAKLQIWDCNGEDQQNFMGTGYYQVAIKKAPTLCIDLPSASTTDGNQLQLWGCQEVQSLQSPAYPGQLERAPAPPPPAPAPGS
jgi:hypothetical protein